MELKEVRRGLYERTDEPQRVTFSPEFAEAVCRHSQSRVLAEILKEAIQRQQAQESAPKL